MPKSWTGDRQRYHDAAIPDEVEFATKPVLAQQMLARALDAGVPAAWVTADEAYGGDSKFRRWLETRRISYVVAVACNQTIPATAGTSRADALAAQAPEDAWKRRSCGDGAKGHDCSTGQSRPCRSTRTPPARLVPLAADAPVPDPQQQRRTRTGLLLMLRPNSNHR